MQVTIWIQLHRCKSLQSLKSLFLHIPFQFHIERESSQPIFHPVFSRNGVHALVRLPVQDGDNGHYMHACQLYANNVIPLTHGAFELSKILAWDEDNHLM